jgi:hypothetical protein
MTSCRQCGSQVEAAFRFCPWCGHAQRLKLTEFFVGHGPIEGEARRALRISRYLGDGADERHVRFSVWSEAVPGKTTVEAAVSLDEDEADRVARFLSRAPEIAPPAGTF